LRVVLCLSKATGRQPQGIRPGHSNSFDVVGLHGCLRLSCQGRRKVGNSKKAGLVARHGALPSEMIHSAPIRIDLETARCALKGNHPNHADREISDYLRFIRRRRESNYTPQGPLHSTAVIQLRPTFFVTLHI